MRAGLDSLEPKKLCRQELLRTNPPQNSPHISACPLKKAIIEEHPKTTKEDSGMQLKTSAFHTSTNGMTRDYRQPNQAGDYAPVSPSG